MGLKELVDWLEKQHDSCKTKEDFNSLILKHEVVLHCVRKKLKDIGAGGDAAVGHVGLGVHPTPTRSNLEGCEFNHDNFNLSKDCTSKGNHIGFLTLPENSAVRSDSSGKEPMRSDLEDLKYNPEDFVGLEDLNVSLEIWIWSCVFFLIKQDCTRFNLKQHRIRNSFVLSQLFFPLC